MIRSTDPHIPLRHVPRHVPGRLAVTTVYRWALKGIGNPPVRLETLKVGGRRVTTLAALDAFFAALTQHSSALAVSDPARRDAAVRQAEHQLDADGI